jgi:nucleotide-binding universal stress UspA family protein
VVVAVDASAASLDAAAAAAAVAARLGSELAGLFVEDEDVLRLAALPFGVVQAPGGHLEDLDVAGAEARLRAVAAHAREILERAAALHRVACSFRVARGRVAAEVIAASEGADLVVLGAASHGRAARGAVGQTARATVAGARAPVLLLARGARLGAELVAVDDGTPAGAQAVEAARRLAAADRPPALVTCRDLADPAVAAAVARLGPAVAAVPATAGARGGLAERLLGAGIAVLLVRDAG